MLLTESFRPATIELMIERLSCTLAGGLLALGAAVAFWPTWERTRFPAVLAWAIRANCDYLQALFARLAAPIGVPDAELSRAKRRAESMNQKTFGSLARIYADPVSHREGAEQAAVLANGNLRLMRALNLLLVQAGGTALSAEELARLGPAVREMTTALEELSETIKTSLGNGNASTLPVPRLTPMDGSSAQPLLPPLARAQAEIGAMYASLRRPLPQA